jgi:hypothetical protein
MPQTNEVPRLIERESGGVRLAASKALVDFSAVMDGGFGRLGADQRSGKARSGVGEPAGMRNVRGLASGWACFHMRKNLKLASQCQEN